VTVETADDDCLPEEVCCHTVVDDEEDSQED